MRDAVALRSAIGLAGQYAAVDELLTGRENLQLVGQLYHLGRAERRQRGERVLEQFQLAGAADRPVRAYSGGMRRRLDLAASLVGQPPVLILDEPTTGLDPRSRVDLWQHIEDLVAGGTTILLTTQYLEEADRLAHWIVVIDRGQVIAQGTAGQLKNQVGGAVIDLQVTDPAQLEAAAAVLTGLGDGQPQTDPVQRRATVPATGERGDPAGGRRPSRTRRTYRAGRTEASSRMACACPWSVTLTQHRNHRDPVTASHLAGGNPGPVAKARTAARDVLRDPREIP